MESRRDALKIIGAIGTTCAFPFSADELYGQHVHSTAVQIQAAAGPYKPKFFTAAEWDAVSRIADLIIPPTDTPGAVGAGVPQYIDTVVNVNPEQQKQYRAGLAWLDAHASERFAKPFRELSETQQIELLTPLSDAVDHDKIESAGEKLFRALKSMTADGYYTSQIGLVQELGYQGNTALASFEGCTHEH